MSKILIYIEPHPIRGSLTHFVDVLDSISSIFLHQNGNTIKIYSNLQTLDKIIEKGYVPIDSFLPPTPEEQDFFESLLVDWTSEGIPLWLQLLTGGDICKYYQNILQKLHSRFSFDYIFYWGTNQAVKNFSIQNHVRQLSLELGCSRPPFENTIVADPLGVNGNSFLCDVSVNDLPASSKENWLMEMILRNQEVYQLSYDYCYSEELLRVSNKKIAFIPLQLFDDANLLIFSPFSSLKEFLKACLPRLLNDGYYCIIKEHPASKFRRGAQESNLEAKIYAFSLSLSNITWISCSDNSPSNCFFYCISELVITNNSSAGFEALLYDLPVVVLGKAVYKMKDAFPSLEEALSGKINYSSYKKNIKKILSFFYNYYLISSETAKTSIDLISHLKNISNLPTIRGNDDRTEWINFFCEAEVNKNLYE